VALPSLPLFDGCPSPSITHTLQQKANLARPRDKQRRCRARKREYQQELEQRLRLCELQATEASTEVQVAARRVTEENGQLRELLRNQGVSDDYITYYVQASMIAPDLNPTLSSGLPGPVVPVQALQQLLVPGRLIAPDPVVEVRSRSLRSRVGRCRSRVCRRVRGRCGRRCRRRGMDTWIRGLPRRGWTRMRARHRRRYSSWESELA
jgi:hypothetical protein